MGEPVHVWDMRNPDGGASGLEFSRARLAPHEIVLAHAVPERVDVVVRGGDGALVARADRLWHEAVAPKSRFTLRGGAIERENIWPDARDVGRPVILAGGEVGILREWWNSEARDAWRWVLELENHLTPRP